MSFDNFKSHRETGFQPLLRRYNFQKTIGGVKLTSIPPAVFRVKYFFKNKQPALIILVLYEVLLLGNSILSFAWLMPSCHSDYKWLADTR